jgi:hypothetical protein
MSLDWQQIGSPLNGAFVGIPYGNAVSISTDGTRIAVGNEDNNVVKVYELSGGTYAQLGADITDVTITGMGRTTSMSGDGTRVAIGAPQHNSNNGIVRVYEYNGSSWVQLGSDTNFTPPVGAEMGSGIVLSKNGIHLVVGMTGINAMRVYDYDGSNWIQRNGDIVGPSSTSNFGVSIAFNEDMQYVASSFIFGIDGRVRVYRDDGASWINQTANPGNSLITGDSTDQGFGNSIDMAHDTLTGRTTISIASGGGGTGGTSDNNRVKVYEFNGSTWVQFGPSIFGPNSSQGEPVYVAMSHDGKRIIMGEPLVTGLQPNSGIVSVWELFFVSTFPAWQLVGTIIPGTITGGEFGGDVVISGDGTRIAVSTPFSSEVRAYELGLPTTTSAPTTTVAPTTTLAPTTTVAPTTTIAPTTTVAPTTTTGPTTTSAPGSTVHPEGVSGGVTSSNFGFGEIGCINNYFVVKGEEFPEEKCDYTMIATCNLYEIFTSNDATDPDTDGPGSDIAGFQILLNQLCECLKNSVCELRYTEGTNDLLIDNTRGAGDTESWLNVGVQKYNATDPLASPFGADYTLIENQHFTFEQDNGPSGSGYYSVPRCSIFDKLVRTFLHCTSPFFNEGTVNYHQVSKLISQSFCEWQNKVTAHNTTYTDVYHEQISERVEQVINENNQEFRTKLVNYALTQGDDPTDIDLTDYTLNFCFDYRFQTLDLSEVDTNNPGEYNNNCPDDGNTKITNADVHKTMCLKIVHDGSPAPAPTTTIV